MVIPVWNVRTREDWEVGLDYIVRLHLQKNVRAKTCHWLAAATAL